MSDEYTEINWESIESYRPFIYSLCQKRQDVIGSNLHMDVDDLVSECMIHIYNHKDRYNSSRGGVGTFIYQKVKQQLWKISSKNKTMKKNEDEYFEYKKRELENEIELDNKEHYNE